MPEILDALESADDIYLDVIGQVRLATWSAGRVGIIGDAAACASPAAGQGTTLGLVTAYVTAAQLATTAAVPAALTAAEQQLRAFAEGNQALGPANLKRMVLPTERAVRSTLFALKVMNALPFTDLELGAVARKLARASAYDLPAVPDAAAR
ncbi:FAD-dependent monooxygenase [Nostocoides australiense]|nr:FAD-dependent monooxygenase [Tetrasphaera australiensis]